MTSYTEWQIIDSNGYFVCGGANLNHLIAEDRAAEMFTSVFKPGYKLYFETKYSTTTPGKIRR
jgi:hypothetical protein